MAILDEPIRRGTRSGALEKLRIMLTQLAPSERKVAEYILQDPGQAVALSIYEIAQFCNVSQPTVSRFCRSLGFSNYAALRIGIANDLASALSQEASDSLVEESTPNFATLLKALSTISEMTKAAQAIRLASRVEVWPTPELAHIGAQLADRLAALGITASCATIPLYWSARAKGLAPEAVVIVLSHIGQDALMEAALRNAQQRGARILYCAARIAGSNMISAEWFLPLPNIEPAGIAELAFVEVLVKSVRQAFDLAIPDGPASPWQSWPYQQHLFLPVKDNDPIPAILLTCENPPRPRPLILYFSGLHQTKESGLPGTGNNHICRCIVASLLNSGYHVLTIDARAHGERKRGWENAADLIRRSLSGEGENILQGAYTDAPSIVNGALELGVTEEAARIGVVGTSWGGLQATLTFAGDSRIACCVGVMPVCQVTDLPEFSHFRGKSPILINEPGVWIAEQLVPRPFLLILGEEDDRAKPQSAMRLIEMLQPAYREQQAEEQLQSFIIPELGHVEHPQQIRGTLDWLKRFFL